MRLVTWNCYRSDVLSRVGDLTDLDADVVVLQECARPASVDAGAVAWFGANLRHGAATVVPSDRILATPPDSTGQC